MNGMKVLKNLDADQPLVNAYLYEPDTPPEKKLPPDTRQSSRKIDPFKELYVSGEAIEPPYEFEKLADAIRMSNTLPQCIDAMTQNCEGFGYNLVSKVTEDEKEILEGDIKDEADRIKWFFKYISYEMSFTQLRKKVRKDLESFGNGFIEVLRNGNDEIDGLEYLKAITMRMGATSRRILCKVKRQVMESYEYEEVDYRKRFRTFVQVVGNEKVFFKEIGDPRRIDSTTGKEITAEIKYEYEEQGKVIVEATEVIHFKLEDPSSPYGIPRWLGNICSVAGSRAAEEVNAAYFDNKAIPPMAIMVSGGKLAAKTHAVIKDFVNSKLKGRDNYHKILVMEAQGTATPNSLEKNPVRIQIKELSQMKEGVFLEYDGKNREKIRSSFRLPPIYIGLSEDYTRATAKESKEIAEEQVFGPEKAEFDFMINHKLFPELEVKYHEFKTKSAPLDNRMDQAELIKVLGESGVTAKEARKEIEKLVDIDLEDLEADWLNYPMELAKVYGRKPEESEEGEEGSAGQGEEGEEKQSKEVDQFVGKLLRVREALRKKIGIAA